MVQPISIIPLISRHLTYLMLLAYEFYIILASLVVSYYSYRASRILQSRSMAMLSIGIMLFGVFILINTAISVVIIMLYAYSIPFIGRSPQIPVNTMHPLLLTSEVVEFVSLMLIAFALSYRETYMPMVLLSFSTIYHGLMLVNIILISYITVMLWLRYSSGNRLVILTAFAFTILLLNIPIEALIVLTHQPPLILLLEERVIYTIVVTLLMLNVIRVFHHGKA